jgi:FMN phosphatase YigB (HAD superfamily)
VALDKAWFAEFKRDLSDEKRWRVYYTKYLASERKEKGSDAAEEAAYTAPPVPDIQAEYLYWEMMRIAREPDPHMYPALKKLRAAADASDGKLVLAAMSNTSIFPAGHAFNDVSTPEGKQNAELKGLFDVFVSSAHVGLRKPAEDIYFYTLGRVAEFMRQKGWGGEDLRMQDVVFLDDIGGNLRTGRKVGMRTIKVVLGKTDLAVKELEKITGISLVEEKAKL